MHKRVRPPAPPPVVRAIEQVGHNLALARRRRRLSQATMAERIGISTASLRRLEGGDPAVAWGTVARALFVLGALDKLNSLLDAGRDDIGLLLEDENLPKRIRTPRRTPETGAL